MSVVTGDTGTRLLVVAKSDAVYVPGITPATPRKMVPFPPAENELAKNWMLIVWPAEFDKYRKTTAETAIVIVLL